MEELTQPKQLETSKIETSKIETSKIRTNIEITYVADRSKQRKRRKKHDKCSKRVVEGCFICNVAKASYKCPKCRIKYCSVKCSKIHKEVGCSYEHLSTIHANQMVIQNKRARINYTDTDETVVDPNCSVTLLDEKDQQALLRSKRIRSALRDPWLQLVLVEINNPLQFEKNSTGLSTSCKRQSISLCSSFGATLSPPFRLGCPNCKTGFTNQTEYIKHLLKSAGVDQQNKEEILDGATERHKNINRTSTTLPLTKMALPLTNSTTKTPTGTNRLGSSRDRLKALQYKLANDESFYKFANELLDTINK